MSIRKKVANLWAPLLQSKGNSTTQPMSQKAVSDELSQLKSDLDNNVNELNNTLVAKASMLSYEEIMASTPPIDLDIGIPKASAITTLLNIVPKGIFNHYFEINNTNTISVDVSSIPSTGFSIPFLLMLADWATGKASMIIGTYRANDPLQIPVINLDSENLASSVIFQNGVLTIQVNSIWSYLSIYY